MSNFVVEIQAPAIVAAIQQLAAVLSANKSNSDASALPQTAAEQAIRQQVVPAQAPQQYQPAPVNPTPAPQPATPAVPVAAAPIAQTPHYAPTSALPAAPATSHPAPTATPVNTAPIAAAPTFSMEDLARAASQLMDAGKQQDLLGLLAQFGVQALTQLPPERYGEFATALRQMGAKL